MLWNTCNPPQDYGHFFRQDADLPKLEKLQIPSFFTLCLQLCFLHFHRPFHFASRKHATGRTIGLLIYKPILKACESEVFNLLLYFLYKKLFVVYLPQMSKTGRGNDFEGVMDAVFTCLWATGFPSSQFQTLTSYQCTHAHVTHVTHGTHVCTRQNCNLGAFEVCQS